MLLVPGRPIPLIARAGRWPSQHTSAAAGTFLADRSAHPTFWVPDTASDGNNWITGPVGSNVVNGSNLTYVASTAAAGFSLKHPR